MISNSNAELIDADAFEPASTPMAAQCCARVAAHPEDSDSEILEMSKAQGFTLALVLELSQLQALANDVVCLNTGQDKPCDLQPCNSSWSQTHNENSSFSSSSQA